MKYYECDFCGARMHEPLVGLMGITGTSGGILLPESLHTKEFCNSECFWGWCDKYHPVKEKGRP